MINIKRLTVSSYRKGDNLKFYCLSKYNLYKLLETSKTYIKLKYIIPKVVEIEITNSNVILLPLLISFIFSTVVVMNCYTTLTTGAITTIAISQIMSFIAIIILMILLSVVSIVINFVVELISSIIIIRKVTK